MSIRSLLNRLPGHERERQRFVNLLQRDLVRLYDRTHDDLFDILRPLFRRKDTPSLTEINTSPVTSLLSSRVDHLSLMVRHSLMSRVPGLSTLLTRQLAKEVLDIGDMDFRSFSPDAIDRRFSEAANRIAAWNRHLTPDMMGVIREAVRRGDDPKLLASIIAAKNRLPGGRAAPIARARAHMLANVRYAALDASNEIRQTVYHSADSGLFKVWWSDPSSCCYSCAVLHGTVVPIMEEFEWRILDLTLRPHQNRLFHPPLHPNCKCRIVPVTQDLLRDHSLVAARVEGLRRAEAVRSANSRR